MRPAVHFDEHQTASRMPTQTGRRILLANAAAPDYEVESWDMPGVYMYAPGNPNFRVAMTQPPRANGTFAAPGKICLLRRAITGASDANAFWDE